MAFSGEEVIPTFYRTHEIITNLPHLENEHSLDSQTFLLKVYVFVLVPVLIDIVLLNR